MFELFTSRFYLLGVSFHLFRSVSTQSFLLCRRNLRGTREVLTPEQEESRRFQECFRDTMVRKEHRKGPWMHHKWHSQGCWTPPQAQNNISDTESMLQMLHKCSLRRQGGRWKLGICRPHFDHHNYIFFSVHAHRKNMDVNCECSSAQTSLKRDKMQQQHVGKSRLQTSVSAKKWLFASCLAMLHCLLPAPFPSLWGSGLAWPIQRNLSCRTLGESSFAGNAIFACNGHPRCMKESKWCTPAQQLCNLVSTRCSSWKPLRWACVELAPQKKGPMNAGLARKEPFCQEQCQKWCKCTDTEHKLLQKLACQNAFEIRAATQNLFFLFAIV